MTDTAAQDFRIAYLLLRATLGLNILLHGVSRILSGPTTFAHALIPMFAQTPLPSGFVYVFGIVLPWAEAALGLHTLIGLKTRWALVLGSLLILTLTFGATLRQDWESAGLQLIYSGIYAGLLAFRQYNRFSLDALLHTKASQEA